MQLYSFITMKKHNTTTFVAQHGSSKHGLASYFNVI